MGAAPTALDSQDGRRGGLESQIRKCSNQDHCNDLGCYKCDPPGFATVEHGESPEVMKSQALTTASFQCYQH